MKAITTQRTRDLCQFDGDAAVTNRYLPLKRALDILLAFVLLVLFGPLMLAIALGIRIASSGPRFLSAAADRQARGAFCDA